MKFNIRICLLFAAVLLCLTQQNVGAQERAQRQAPSASGSLASSDSLQDEARRLQEAETRLLQRMAAVPAEEEKAVPAEVQPVRAEVREAPKSLSLPDPEPAIEPAPTTAPAADPALSNLQDKTREQASLIFRLQKSSMDLTGQLRSRDQKLQELKRQLSEARNRLIVAETEVERISRNRDNCNAAYVSSYGSKQIARPQAVMAPQAAAPAQQTMRARVSSRPPVAKAAPAAPPAPAEPDLPVAIVKVDKAALRAGPGPENSQLMAVSKGTRLTVETRSGSWYRVNTPTGTRAWISADVVGFGSAPSRQSSASATSAIKVGGYDASAEDKAF